MSRWQHGLALCGGPLLCALACGPQRTYWIGADEPALHGDAGARDGEAEHHHDAGEQLDPALLPPGAPNDSIFLYWLLDDDALDVAADASGHQRAGVLTNAPSLSDPAPTARVHNVRGRFFNGTGERASYQGDALPSAFTVAMWVRPALASQASLFARSSAEPARTLELVLGESGAFELRSGGQTQEGPCTLPEACAQSRTLATEDVWHHLALSVDGGHAQLFVDGQAEASLQLSPLGQEVDLLELAASSQSTRPGFRGLLDELIVYARALSPAEVVSLAAAKD